MGTSAWIAGDPYGGVMAHMCMLAQPNDGTSMYSKFYPSNVVPINSSGGMWWGTPYGEGVCQGSGFYGSGALWLIYPYCPAGTSYDTSAKKCVGPVFPPDKPLEQCPIQTKCPIQIGVGNKKLVERDLTTGSLRFTRTYNSINRLRKGLLGAGWTHNYDRVVISPVPPVAAIRRPSGAEVEFFRNASLQWISDGDLNDRLTEITDGAGVRTGWRYYSAREDQNEEYDAQGRLKQILPVKGATQTLVYTDGTNGSGTGEGGYVLDASGNPTSTVLPAGLLLRVTDNFGYRLSFGYNSQSRVVAVSSSATKTERYAYDAVGNLTGVTHPDNTSKTYLYGETSHIAAGSVQPNVLTGVIDESNVRYASYWYDAAGRPVDELQGEGLLSGVSRAQITYSLSGDNIASASVTDALGTARNYGFSRVLGVARPQGTSITGGLGGIADYTNVLYDANGNATSRTDFNGVVSTYTFDLTRNLETSRTEAVGTPRVRTITTQWHPVHRRPTLITEPGRTTENVYDSVGNLLTRTITDTATSTQRIWTYTYNAYGQILTADGPRTDVVDRTTYTYYDCTSGLECGQLHTVTNALNQTTTYNAYNSEGQPLTITDANGVLTSINYDGRSHIASRTVAGELTRFEYWPSGLIKKTTMPDSSFVLYNYDAAQRLTDISDSEGNHIVYTLDAMGNRTHEEVRDPLGTLTRTSSSIFNQLGQLYQAVPAASTPAVTTTFGYDANGNQTTVNAPLGRNSINAYDELNRLKQVTDANNGITQYGYNALDQLISVTDPRNLQTVYTYNALGDLTQQLSPDTGTTINTFDSGGNLKTTIDARSKSATYTYDALNRVTQVVYPDQTLNYTYDLGANAVGKISSVTDSSGSTSWTYTPQGRIATKTQVMGAMVMTVQYGYNAAGQLTTITTPSNKTITYGYTNNQVTNMMVNSVNLLNDVLYEPFGPTSGWTWGNGTLSVRTYDTDGKLTQLDSAGFKTIGYDDAFRISSVIDQDNSANSWSYGYDTLDRLTSAIGSQMQLFSFDANGNRLTQGGASSSTFTVSPTSNRLSSVSGAVSKSYLYDNAGNTTSDGSATYAYNDSGRMISVTKSGVTTTYTYNALGQRVTKTTAGNTTYFVYDEAGHILGEYDNSGLLIQETAWMYDMPVASIRFGSCGLAVFYIHTDHLNTPRRITKRSTNEVVWRWDSDAFGTTMANENPSGLGMFVFNLRFPGQYFDSETGLLYNWNRYYDPQGGRYITSDPIGLDGGINTYAYVGGNPISFIDPLGLDATTVDAWCMRNPAACADVMGGGQAATRTKGAAAAALKKNCPDEDCGSDTRLTAYTKALAWAGTSIVNDWIPIPWNQYGGRGGPNYSYVRGNGSSNYGYYDSQGTKARVMNHPDGHPDQTGAGFPDHHNCPHFHAINAQGVEQIFIYKRGT
jgi:RHS repeat-associated protein